VVRKGRTGLFRFNLVGPNGKVIATSQAYQSRSSALRGIEAVRKYAAHAELVDDGGTRVVGGRAKTGTPKQVRALPTSDVGIAISIEAVRGDVVRPRIVG
jgi:uncharacterized protein YegP (UPF0339 family)